MLFMQTIWKQNEPIECRFIHRFNTQTPMNAKNSRELFFFLLLSIAEFRLASPHIHEKQKRIFSLLLALTVNTQHSASIRFVNEIETIETNSTYLISKSQNPISDTCWTFITKKNIVSITRGQPFFVNVIYSKFWKSNRSRSVHVFV